MLTASRLVLASLWQYRRIHLAVALAVAAATAVLTGALLTGDSMRGSLRDLAFDRLGTIDEVVLADRFFRSALAEELRTEPGFASHFNTALPGFLVEGTLELASEKAKARASQVTIVGCDQFATFYPESRVTIPKADQIVLNQTVAQELGIPLRLDETQDSVEILLRIGQSSQIPADSPLGRKTETVRSRRLKVIAVIPTQGMGRFGLRPNQQLPSVGFVSTATLQEMLEQPGRVNALFVSSKNAAPLSNGSIESQVKPLLHPTLDDVGLNVERTPTGYVNITSTRMMLEPAVEEATRQAFAGRQMQTAFTYLANYIQVASGKGKIPYSTVTALNPLADPPLGPLTTAEGETVGDLQDDEIVLNLWAADDFAKQGVALKQGDPVVLEFFEPESTHGEVRESTATFRLRAVVEMTPVSADRAFTPELPGVTDQKSIANWNPPFPFDESRVRSHKPHDEDEAYWQEFKATPKAFISLAAGQKLWASRFGQATSLRIAPQADDTPQSLGQSLLGRLHPEQFGFQFLPVKSIALRAAAGTTPFNFLFLGFSIYIMLAALLLIALLFRLGIEQRASEMGVLQALGWRWRGIGLLFCKEATLVSLFGGVLGTLLGVAYAWLMVVGLRTWWLGAIGSPFVKLHVSGRNLLIGLVAGVLVSLLTIALTLWRMRRLPVRRMLAGEATEASTPISRPMHRAMSWLASIMIVVAVLVGLLALRMEGDVRAGAFFGSAALTLIASLLLVSQRIQRGDVGGVVLPGPMAALRVAARNASRNPRRSTLTIGLVAAASFLLVAMSAFRLDPTQMGVGPNSGSGGFVLMAESDQPIYQNLDLPQGRSELGFADREEKIVANANIMALRVQAGDDASCLNLYQTQQPRVIGVPEKLIERGGFAWSGSLAADAGERRNPWELLNKAVVDNGKGLIPAILDANTATYGLHKGLGDTLELRDGRGQPMNVQIVGLLKNSVFQGSVLVGERDFRQLYPGVNGYRMFLVDAPAEQMGQVKQTLETVLGDYGFDARSTLDRLADLFAVQNTYLSTFQSLGGLGLLLGTLGLAAVQLRNIFERRGELALMRASGFSRAMLGRMVLAESSLLLLGGLAVGVITALIAVLPHWWSGDALVPWLSLAGTLGLVLLAGLAACAVAVRAVVRAPLIPALRGE